MDMILKVAMECHKHRVGLDTNKGMIMVVKECHKHQVGMYINNVMEIFMWPTNTQNKPDPCGVAIVLAHIAD